MALGKNPLDNLKDEYDKLVTKLIKVLKDLVNRLNEEKRNIKQRRANAVTQLYTEKKETFKTKKEEFYEGIRKKGEKPGFLMTAEERMGRKNRDLRIQELEVEMERLLNEEMQISQGEARTFADEEKSLDEDIEKVSQLLRAIEEKTGVGKFSIKIFGKGGKNTAMLTPQELNAIYQQIVKVHDHLVARGQEDQRETTRFEPMMRQLGAKADDIIGRLKVVISGGTTPS